MNIVVFSCPYSANLGDGLLSLCFGQRDGSGPTRPEREHPGPCGAQNFGECGMRRKTALALLDRLPRAARAPVMALSLGFEVSRKLRPAWAEALSNADAAVLGGGNLLADADLNFPLKIAGFGAEMRGRGIPWAVFGVGASAPWTKRGRRLFESAFLTSAIMHVTVRDSRSKTIWDEAFVPQGALEAAVCSDPAILACDHFPKRRHAPRDRPVLGLNITAPDELSMHADIDLETGRSLLEWWLELVALTIESGYVVRMFTNGSLRDEKYLSLLKKRVKQTQTAESLIFVPRPRNPETLAATIADCDTLAGHRLHAHIPAFSYRIPSVGFAWDIKLRSFFESVNRGEFVMEACKSSPGEVVQCILHAHSTGVGEQAWRAATKMARSSIAKLLAALEEAVLETHPQEGVSDV